MRVHPARWAVRLFVLLAVSGDLPCRADRSAAEEAFRAGIVAADAEDWQGVRESMARALEERPVAGGRVRIYGMRFEDYRPLYWLGLSHVELADCAAALSAWSRVDPETLSRDRGRDLEDRRSECETRASEQVQTFGEAPRTAEAGEVAVPEAVPAASAPTDPPAFLVRAADDLLAARYERVVAELRGGSEGEAPNVEATRVLLRAAARYALSRTVSTGRDELLADVRRDVERYLVLRPEDPPSPRWFSPAFRELFEP